MNWIYRIPQIDGLSDLNCSRPDADRHQWLPHRWEVDLYAILAVLIRAADRCWAMHRRHWELPALVLDAAQPMARR